MSTRTPGRNRAFATVVAAACVAAVTLLPSGANAAIVATVDLGTATSFSVLAGTTVTNTGPSRLHRDLGLWDAPASTGVAVTGFSNDSADGQLVPPAAFHIDDAVAQQAQSALTAAYVDAADRPGATSTGQADVGGLTLQGGVYDVPGGAISLTGTLTLDGADNADSVFIFQAASTLITASSSTVRLINGAQACNVFWQVGSSATLGSSSVFVGNILALTSISVNDGVTVDGRALARNGAVTLINDTFVKSDCTAAAATTTTTAAPTTTTAAPTTTTTTAAPTTTTTPAPAATTPTTTPIAATPVSGPVAGSPIANPSSGSNGSITPLSPAAPTSPSGPTAGGGTSTGTPTGRITTAVAAPGSPTGGLARTGSALDLTFLAGLALVMLGAVAVRLGRTS